MIPGAALAVIDDCGHMAPMERPERVAEALAAWLRMPLRRSGRTPMGEPSVPITAAPIEAETRRD